MATTTIYDLPAELLDKIYSYLDWDRSKNLTPTRPNIISISLTCWHLREAVVPTLFRNVHLRVRWVDDALVEPGLVKMRRHAPHLAKNVRCVSIKTLSGRFADPAFRLQPFAVPEDVEDWWDLAPLTSSESQTERALSHRKQVNEAATSLFEDPEYASIINTCAGELRIHAVKLMRRLFGDASYVQSRRDSSDETNAHPEALVRLGDSTSLDEMREVGTQSASDSRRRKYRNLRIHLDALVVVILCLPPSLNMLVFESHPSDRMDARQYAFSLHIVATTLKVFSDRILSITTDSDLSGVADPMRNERDELPETRILNSDIISSLQHIKELKLSSGHGGRRTAIHEGWKLWHTISASIAHLSFFDTDIDPHKLVEVIEKFTSLHSLTLQRVVLQHPLHVGRLRHGQGIWLPFLIELRRLMPNVTFHLQELLDCGTPKVLGTSALRFLLEQAVPKGAAIDSTREARLTQDFDAFVPLWEAEDSARGDQAKEARKDGKLVDLAMTNRWKTFAHLR